MALKKKGTPEKIDEVVVTEADLDRWAKLRVEQELKENKPKKAKK